MKAIIFIFGILFLFGCVQTEVENGGETVVPQTPAEEPEEIVINVPVSEEPEEVPEEEVPEEEEIPNPLDLIEHKEKMFETKDGWDIYGTVYYASREGAFYPDTLIILIPALGKDRSTYDELVPLLHDAFPTADVLALDMRGHGKSTNRGDYSNFQTGDFRAMPNDLEAVKSYYSVARPYASKFYLVGASMGSSVALNYAADHGEVDRVVMISPGVAYQDFDIIEDAEIYLHRLYVTAGSEDAYSASSANQIYNSCPSDNKKSRIYQGVSAHGTDLFDATKDTDQPLLELVTDWLRE